MKALVSLIATLLLVATLAAGCGGTTGDALVAFPAYAAGAPGAGEPFTANGYAIQLTFAQMYVGAVYVNEAPPGSGGTFDSPVCIDPGVYCAQVPGGVEVNLLSTTPQPFAVGGSGSADLGESWEMYLAYGDVNDPSSTGFGVPNTADLQGTATRQSDGAIFSWAATVTIGQSNRGAPIEEPGQPGLDPICKQRILELGDVSLTLYRGATMLLTIDPRGWFKLPIDFASLPPVTSAQCQADESSNYGSANVCIPDSSALPGATPGAQQGINLFTGILTAGAAAYHLTYQNGP